MWVAPYHSAGYVSSLGEGKCNTRLLCECVFLTLVVGKGTERSPRTVASLLHIVALG